MMLYIRFQAPKKNAETSISITALTETKTKESLSGSKTVLDCLSLETNLLHHRVCSHASLEFVFFSCRAK